MIWLYWLIFLGMVCLREFRVLKEERADPFVWGCFLVMSIALFGVALLVGILKYNAGDPR